ncbi:MAG: hypothetical protein IAE89_16870 [Anaerolineae bacterium]|nr:hypothetical protein [Anaerolineae bacterium]
MPILLFALLLAAQAQTAAAFQTEAIPPSYALVAENQNFQLYVDSDTLAFKLRDQRSGYLWHSGLDEILEGDRLNTSWQAFAKSGLSIEYLDIRASNRRVSITNSAVAIATTPVDQGISAEITFQDYGITVGLILQLEEDGVRAEISEGSIREENPDFRLGKVYLYPFLGAVRGSSIPGYMFIPDGTGSLIPYADATRATNMLYGRYYNADLGIISMLPYDPLITNPYSITYPVFGAVHGEGENAFVSIVEEGAAYGEVDVHPAGVLTNYNFLHNTFIYNQPYFQATNRSGAGVTTVQRDRNSFDVVVHYRFLTGEDANYIGMARSYQQYLVDQGLLHRSEETNPDNIGIRLEFLGGDSERVLFWDRFIPMTTVSQMSDILADLQIPNPEVIYYGWQPSGATSVPPTSVQLEGQLGTLDELRALTDATIEAGGHLSLYFDPQAALVGKSGYSPYSDLAMSITNANIWGWNRYETNYFSLNPLRDRFNTFANAVAEQLGAGLALDSIGSILYSDFSQNAPINRESMLDAYQSLLSESPVRLGLYRPNDYLFGVTQAYYDMPLGDSSYIYASEAVPFLPAVLAGYIPYYGTALNFSSNWQDDLLRHIEYGIYPSYFLTHEPTSNMLNTPSGWIYSSSFDQWGDEIQNTYAWMNALLAPVRGQEIMAHEQLAANVFATTFANNRQIIVNYADQPFTLGEITVEPRNAVLVELNS